VPIERIENEIRRFLSAEEAEVLCVSGRWGVGKTYAWHQYLKGAQAEGAIALNYYSYVSLFGINSLDELKYSIFENLVPSTQPGAEPTLKAVMSRSTSALKHFSKKVFGVAQKSSLAQHYVGGLGPVCFFSVKDSIVCIDDIERRGDDLSVRDVLGLVSLLKEQRRCKVILILNDEELAEKRREFDRYFEKVIDARLNFAPSAKEAARIALTANTAACKMLSESSVALGIENIRVIKKIQRMVDHVEPMLREFDEEVLRKAVRGLALFGWSVYEPGRAPSIDCLKARVPGLHSTKPKGAEQDDEAPWNALLDAYEFTTMDEFDLVLLDAIRDGVCDPELIKKHAFELNTKIAAGKSLDSYMGAWRLYHHSFAVNEERVCEAVHQSFIDTVQYRTPVDLNGTVWLLKNPGRTAQASECIDRYVASRGEDRKAFALDSFPFRDHVDDLDVIKAFKDKRATLKDERDPVSTLLRMAYSRGLYGEDINMLAALPSAKYYEMFKESDQGSLLMLIDACLQFDRIGHATAPMREISKRAREALARIGAESRINALRVAKYGIDIASTTVQDASKT
jgi:hypothetical protein